MITTSVIDERQTTEATVLQTQHDSEIAVVRLDHGPVNALDVELLLELIETASELDRDPSVRAIVLTGNERAFSAGVDLKRILEEGTDHCESFLEALTAAFLATLRCDTPTVAAVDGHAIAGGAVLAAACDRVFCADDDKIRVGLAELRVGVPFPAAAISIMRRRLGPRLSEAVLSAATYTPREALQLGMIDHVVARGELLDVAIDEARRLAAVPPSTMRLSKEQLRGPVEDELAAHGAEQDRRMLEGWNSPEVRRAIEEFVEQTMPDREPS